MLLPGEVCTNLLSLAPMYNMYSRQGCSNLTAHACRQVQAMLILLDVLVPPQNYFF